MRLAFRLSSLAALVLVSRAASADTIRLSTGETLNVTILEVTDATIRFEHPVLGEVTLPRSAVEILPAAPSPPLPPEAAAEAAPAGAPAQAAPTTSAPPAAAATQSQPEPPPKEWKFRLVLAAASTSGNTDNANFSTIFTATRETPYIKTLLDASYFVAESNDETTENRFSTGFRNDWLRPGSKWFWFVDGRYDHDQFQSWDDRVSAHVGVGYHLIEPPKLRLDLLAGIGAVKEWGSENDDVRPEGLLGVDGEYTFAEKHSVKFASTIYPDLSDVEVFRWVNTVAWAWAIDEETDLALTAGLQHEYQSEVDEGRDKNDLRVYTGLQLDF